MGLFLFSFFFFFCQNTFDVLKIGSSRCSQDKWEGVGFTENLTFRPSIVVYSELKGPRRPGWFARQRKEQKTET